MPDPQTFLTTIAQEQAWNHRQMLEPVTRPRFRVWTYGAPAVVLGCSQRKFETGARARLAPEVDLLLRPSGGGAVLVGPWMVSCSVVLPLSHPWVQGRLPDSYQGLGRLHVQVLAQFGVPSRALPPAEVDAANALTGATVPWACYGSLAPWEVVDDGGRKLVGLAQRRQRTGVLLVAGTLVTPPDWALLCQALEQPGDEVAMHRRTVSCDQLGAQSPDAPQLAQALQAALARALAA
ncbi:MAG: ligase [Proteobacteria bacterium]|nr:ligase [Pseudomonadota bacterium]